MSTSSSLPALGEKLHRTASGRGGRPQIPRGSTPERRQAGKPKTAGSAEATKRKGNTHRPGGKKGGKGAATVEETPEQQAAKNLEIFEKNLAGLDLPKGAIGKGAGGGR